LALKCSNALQHKLDANSHHILSGIFIKLVVVNWVAIVASQQVLLLLQKLG